jgi:hypothetical protein
MLVSEKETPICGGFENFAGGKYFESDPTRFMPKLYHARIFV